MSERMRPGPIQGTPCFREAVCIHTDKVYDSCREKDCLEDLRVFFKQRDLPLIENAINVKCRKSEIIWVFSDVEEVPFNDGFSPLTLNFSSV